MATVLVLSNYVSLGKLYRIATIISLTVCWFATFASSSGNDWNILSAGKIGIKMEPYFGLKYKFEREENFDDLLIFLDIGYVQRQLSRTLKPTQGIEDNGDGTYTIFFTSMLTSFKVVFTPGVEFDETKPDGITVRSLITMEGNVITHIQREESGRTLHHVYEFTPDVLTITTTAKGLDKVVKRHFQRTR